MIYSTANKRIVGIQSLFKMYLYLWVLIGFIWLHQISWCISFNLVDLCAALIDNLQKHTRYSTLGIFKYIDMANAMVAMLVPESLITTSFQIFSWIRGKPCTLSMSHRWHLIFKNHFPLNSLRNMKNSKTDPTE